MQAALQFSQVGKNFGKSAVLGEIDFSVRPGLAFGLAGVNGAGKTTLMKCLLDFCAPDRGQIEIFGVNHTDFRSRTRLAYLPERFTPPYFLTGRDFLHYALRLQGKTPERIEEVTDEIELDKSALKKPLRSYSKGMTQKLGLAACFLSDKELFILDEPMSGLDPKARALVKKIIARKKAEGATFFFSSHSLSDISELCDEMGVLHRGQLQFIGTAEKCMSTYGENTLEAAFLRAIA